MKIRFKGDSIRFRLGPRDVARLVETGEVVETTRVGIGQSLRFGIRAGGERIAVRATGTDVTVEVPTDEIRQWAGTDRVEITGTQPVGDGAGLSILIEKDFECRHQPAGDEAYPNPSVEE